MESKCNYLAPAAYPDALEAGLAVAHLGRSERPLPRRDLHASGDAGLVAFGDFRHVFVGEAMPPDLDPDAMRDALEKIARAPAN